MRSTVRNGLILFTIAVGLSGCGKKDGDTKDNPAGTTTETPGVASSEPPAPPPPPPPPPPPRVIDCTEAQQQAAQPALISFGRDFQRKGFLATSFVSAEVRSCQFDTQEGRIMASGEYRFKGKMNNDELSFTVNFDTDAGGGNPAYSNFLPDTKLERIVATKRQVLDFLKKVPQASDAAGRIPDPGAT